MTENRKILCMAALCLIGVGLASVSPAHSLRRAHLSQAGRMLILTLRTAKPIPLRRLDRLPAPRDRRARYLCLGLSRVGGRGEKRLCVGGKRHGGRRVGLVIVNAAGRAVRMRDIPARIHRPSPRRLALALLPSRVGLTPHRYRWRVLTRREPCPAASGPRCGEDLPARGFRVFRLRPVRAVGCTRGANGLVRHGFRDRSVVALTFDDGPSPYTDDFLRVLRDKHVHSTFFVVGQEVPGREATLRRTLREGNEVANHTTHHGMLPSKSDLEQTSSMIEAATHFEPCLFRPPGGAVNESVVDAAGALGMRTVTWDVDPGDWSNPSPGTIHSRVMDAVRPGSIVVMHDGGGNRSATLSALPGIIDTLRRRGYRFATVTRLLGNRLVYRPYG